MRCIAYLPNGDRCEAEADNHRLCLCCRARMMGRQCLPRRKPPAYCDRCGAKLRRRGSRLTCRDCVAEEERRLKEKARIEAWLAAERERGANRRLRSLAKTTRVCPLCAGMPWAVRGPKCQACGLRFAHEKLKSLEEYASDRKYIAIG